MTLCLAPTVRAGFLAAAFLALLPGSPVAQERIAVRSESGTPVVALQVLIATGPADEPPGKEGLAHLAARAVTAPILPTLDSLGAHLAVHAYKDAVGFTLIAAPDAWREASQSLLVALFRDPPDSTYVLREKRAIRVELQSRELNPGDAITREGDAALFGADHPWGRPTVGTRESVDRLRVGDVDSFLRTHFTPDRAVVAVVGPVEERLATEHLDALVNSREPIGVDAAPLRDGGATVRRDYNSVTTWVAVSYGLAPSADREALRFLVQLALDELSFSPTRQSIYNARGELIPRIGGGEIRFQLVTPPQEAEAWAQRILEVVREVAHRPMLEELFARRLRRYRGERLNALTAPEDRARELARGLLIDGRASRVLWELDSLNVERLREAVRTLSAPTVVLLGPFLDNAG